MSTNAFVFYETYYDQISEIEDIETQLAMFKAIAAYGTRGEEPNFTGIKKALWIGFKNGIDNAKERYQKTIENGSVGGRPEKLTATDKACIINDYTNGKTQTQLADNYNCSQSTISNIINNLSNIKNLNKNDNDNDNDNEKENVNVVSDNTRTADFSCGNVENLEVDNQYPKQIFNLVQEKNSLLPKEKRIPVNTDIIRFINIDLRTFLDYAKGIHSEKQKQAIINLFDALQNTPLKPYTWNWFCKNIQEFLPETYTRERYLSRANNSGAKQQENNSIRVKPREKTCECCGKVYCSTGICPRCNYDPAGQETPQEWFAFVKGRLKA